MSAEIKSGASTALLTVDATSLGARVEPYDADGGKLFPKPNGAYIVPILYTGGTDAAGTFVFAIRNGSGRILVIRRIYVVTSFNGTAAATTQDIEVVSLTGITADSGGTSYTPGRKRSTWPASTVTSVRSAGAVTLTGNAIQYTFAKMGTPRQPAGASGVFDLDFRPGNEGTYGAIEIDAGTGNALALRLNVIAVAGDSVRGWVEWDER